MSVEALAGAPGPTLAERLNTVVRPEFRAAVLVPAVGDPILGSPACAVPRCVHSSRYGGLCLAHLARWKQAGRPDRREWAQTADPAVMGHRPLQPCLVAECGFGQHRYQLCYKHSQLWDKRGRPPLDQWRPVLAEAPTPVCALPGCVLWAELDGGWCRSHHVRWRLRGRPPTAEFIAYCASYGRTVSTCGRYRRRCGWRSATDCNAGSMPSGPAPRRVPSSRCWIIWPPAAPSRCWSVR